MVPEAITARVAGPPPDSTSARIVALGGGHGLAASLAALRRITDQLTAVVTVADDGGSSGRLRRELGVLPPGDLRTALERGDPAALQPRGRAAGPRGGESADCRAVGAARRHGQRPGLGRAAARCPRSGSPDVLR